MNRQQEGLVIANISGAVKRISELVYKVKSQNGNGEYNDLILKREILTIQEHDRPGYCDQFLFAPQTLLCSRFLWLQSYVKTHYYSRIYKSMCI
jgi:hypothetical protein